MSKKKKVENISETTVEETAVEETAVEETAVEETETKLDMEKFKLDMEKFKLESVELELSSEEYIKKGLKNILDEVKCNNNLPFQGLFIMYLEDMISKLR